MLYFNTYSNPLRRNSVDSNFHCEITLSDDYSIAYVPTPGGKDFCTSTGNPANNTSNDR